MKELREELIDFLHYYEGFKERKPESSWLAVQVDYYLKSRNSEQNESEPVTRNERAKEDCKICNGTGRYHYGGCFGGPVTYVDCICRNFQDD